MRQILPWVVACALAACTETNPAFTGHAGAEVAPDAAPEVLPDVVPDVVPDVLPDVVRVDAENLLDGAGGEVFPGDTPAEDGPAGDGPAGDESPPPDVGPIDTPPASDLVTDQGGPADRGEAVDAGLGPPDGPGPSGLILYWRFDEPTGTVAIDSSGSGINGTYLGEPSLPQPTSAVAPTGFANPYSREFPTTGRPSVRARGARAALQLQPTDQFTLSVWYRATTANPTYGGDLLNVADACIIRLKPNHIEAGRRRDAATSPTYTLAENNQLTDVLDGRWHHVAAVISSNEIRLYLDGLSVAAASEPRPLVYIGNDVVVGRRDQTAAEQQFQGAIDEVRVYRRALTAQEVLTLAQGGP